MSLQNNQGKNLSNNVLFLGNRSDVERIYQAMDVFVFPSRVEGFGIAAIEAQAASVQVIASTELPKDVEMTSSIRRIPLREGAEIWAQAVLTSKARHSDDVLRVLRKKGFGINDQANQMSDYYARLVKEAMR